jgi:hypothetical protein
MSDGFEKFVLDNGVRVLCEPLDHVQSVSIGIWCQTGSRDELVHEGGISHLIEHMLFKGTPTRSAEEIAQAIEGRGGYLNAFTTREETCYYARILSDDLDNAIDVLGDMFANSLFDDGELELEKNVVQEEIRKGNDSPEEIVHDLYHQHRLHSLCDWHMQCFLRKTPGQGQNFLYNAGHSPFANIRSPYNQIRSPWTPSRSIIVNTVAVNRGWSHFRQSFSIRKAHRPGMNRIGIV